MSCDFQNGACLYKSAFDYTALGMAIVSPSLQYIDINKAYCDIIGYSRDELESINFKHFTHPEDREMDEPHIKKLMAGKCESFDSVKRYIHKKGHVVWGKATVRLIRDDEGKPLFFVTQIQDITALVHAENELQRIAKIDYLTDCLNRGAFINQLTEEIERAVRENTPLSLVLCDVDNFKRINDIHGHITGDQVLQKISQVLVESCHTDDFVGRYGGEEFIACLPGTKEDDALIIAENMRCSVENTDFYLDNSSLERMTCSFGVAQFDPGIDQSIDDLVCRVDKFMYEAKKFKNTVFSFRA